MIDFHIECDMGKHPTTAERGIEMNIYHHHARGNQKESWTLAMEYSPEAQEIGKTLTWSWRHVVNFFGTEIMYTTNNKDMAEGFALGHRLQIEEGTD